MSNAERIIDVRTPGEYISGHLKGALNLDVSAPDFTHQVGSLDRGVKYAVYCHSGARSSAAARYMESQGYMVEDHGGYAMAVVSLGALV